MKKILTSLLLIILSISCNSQKNDNIEKYVDRVFYSTNLDGGTNYCYIYESDKGILPISFNFIGINIGRVFAYTFIKNMPNNEYYYIGRTALNDIPFYAIKFNDDKMYEYEAATGSYIGIEMHDNAEDTIINELLITNVYTLAEKGSDEEKYIIDIFYSYMSDNKDADNYVRILYSPDYNPDDFFQDFFGYEYIKAFDILFGYNKTNENINKISINKQIKELDLPDFVNMNEKDIDKFINNIEKIPNDEIYGYVTFIVRLISEVKEDKSPEYIKKYFSKLKENNSYSSCTNIDFWNIE